MKKTKDLQAINQRVFEMSRSLKLLTHLNWPEKMNSEFIQCYRTGKTYETDFAYPLVDYSGEKAELTKLLKLVSANDPLEIFTKKTIESYLDQIELVHSIGSKSFTENSIKIFGASGDFLPGSKISNIEAAQQVVNLSREFDFPYVKEPEICFTANSIKEYLDRRIVGVFKDKGPEVVITDEIISKAAASASRVRLKSGTHFSSYDFKQLFYHEVMTHSLTAINGMNQPVLKTLGCGAPRTLKTQEGLATFAEVITGAIDLMRLKRISLRILSIDMALNGANFTDVFKFFLENGQSEQESYYSAQRVFRGGYPNKSIVFTKDCIYLDGLINIHTLFRWAMKYNKLELTHLLFCGKLSIEDIYSLNESYEQGIIIPPQYLPGWYQKIEGLAGSLVFSLLANIVRINVDEYGKKAA